MIAGDWSWPTSTGSAQVPPLAWRRAPPRPNGRASPPSSPHDVNDSVDTMWEYPGISHVRSFKNLPPYPGFVLMIIVFQKESLVPPKWWPGWLASNLRSSALRAALWAWRSNAKWGTSSARSQSGLGSSAGNFGGARWDKLQLSARNLKFQHVSTCFNLWVSFSTHHVILSPFFQEPWADLCLVWASGFAWALPETTTFIITHDGQRRQVPHYKTSKMIMQDQQLGLSQIWIYQNRMLQKMILPISSFKCKE